MFEQTIKMNLHAPASAAWEVFSSELSGWNFSDAAFLSVYPARDKTFFIAFSLKTVFFVFAGWLRKRSSVWRMRGSVSEMTMRFWTDKMFLGAQILGKILHWWRGKLVSLSLRGSGDLVSARPVFWQDWFCVASLSYRGRSAFVFDHVDVDICTGCLSLLFWETSGSP